MEVREPISQYLSWYQGISDYDVACIHLLSLKIILAHILKSYIDEFMDFDIDKVVQCIDGEPEMRNMALFADQPNLVRNGNTVDKTFQEGINYFDIIFYAFVPQGKEKIKLILNIETQKDYYPGYSLLKRAIYYGCRLISSQQGKEFENPHFNDMEKVYSIWVCPHPPQYKENTINKYSIKEDCLTGEIKEKKAMYDMMTIIMIHLSATHECLETNIIRLLNTLITNDKTYDEKIAIFEKEYGIKTNYQMEREVKNMYTLGRYVLEEGIEKGIDLNFIESIKNLMKNLHINMNEAMDLLNTPAEKRAMYENIINQSLN